MNSVLFKELIDRLKDGERSTIGICKELNVNLFTLLKEVKLMRRKGYLIKGSLLKVKETQDKLSRFKIMRYSKRRFGVKVFDELSSTNDYLKENSSLNEGSVIISDCQLRGRGRNAKSFLSPKGKGIYLSYLLKPTGENIISLTPKLALCILKVLKEYVPDAGIKWINDIVYDGRKLCGILTEIKGFGSSTDIQYAVLGVGINVNSNKDDFSEEVKEVATSLSQILEVGVDRNRIIGRVIMELDKMKDSPYCTEIDREIYNDSLVIKNKEVTFIKDGKEYQGICRGIDSEFRLIVRLKDGGDLYLDSGEISVRGLYGYVG